MLPDELGLLKAIAADPADDLPRLVYADWLDEHDRPARAEFIRLQIERFHRAKTDPGARGISPREYQLLLDHELQWRSTLPEGCRAGSFLRRGFYFRLHCHARHLFESDEAILDPVEELFVTIGDLDTGWLAAEPRPLDLPIRELYLDCREPVGNLLVTVLKRFGPFPWLDTLRIRDRAFGYSGTAALMPDESFPKLTTPDLCNCGLSDPAAEILCESGWVGRLKELFVTGNPISWDWRNRLREAFGASLIE